MVDNKQNPDDLETPTYDEWKAKTDEAIRNARMTAQQRKEEAEMRAADTDVDSDDEEEAVPARKKAARAALSRGGGGDGKKK
jgi:hypothetical protein